MVKRYLHLLLAVVLLMTMVPMLPAQAAGSGSFFVWDDLPTTVNTQRVSLSGLLNQVASSGITYTVEQLSENNEVLQKRDKNAIGITVSSDGKQINVVNLQLFPGNNRVTFYGKRGSSEVSEYFTVKYIDAPILYNLQFIGGSEKKRLNDASETIVTNKNTSSAAQSQFTIEGNAPNASKVIIEFGDNQSRDVAVREDGTDYFVASQIKLNKGKNTIKFKVKNDSQTIEVTREVVYFDDTVTFYDTKMKYDNSPTNVVENDLKLLPNMFVQNTTATKYSISGQVIVPNDYSTNSIGDMRIESAYRKAGDVVGSSSDPINPDKTDKIVVRFSQEVNNPPTTLSGVLNLIDFQIPIAVASNTKFVSANPDLADSSVSWRTFPDTGTANSVLELSIGANDAAKLANVSRIVLRDNVEAKKDPNKSIDVMAYNRQVQLGSAGTAEQTTITVTAGATSAGNVTVTLNDGVNAAITTTVPVLATDTTSAVAQKIQTDLNGNAAITTAPGGLYNVSAYDGSKPNDIVITRKSPGAVNTTISINGGTTGVTAGSIRTVTGVDPVKEVQEITATSGVNKITPISIYFNDGNTVDKVLTTTLSATDDSPAKVLARIHAALLSDSTNFELETATPTKPYILSPITSNDETFTIRAKNAGKVNISFWVDGSYPYTKIVPLAGSFNEKAPYVTEAYVKGTSVANSTRGVDPGEKIIIQFEDGNDSDSTKRLPSSQKSYSKTDVDALLGLVNMSTLGTLGKIDCFGAGSCTPQNYSMIYYETSHRLELTFDSGNGLNAEITSSRTPDGGVGNTKATGLSVAGSLTNFATNIQTTGNKPLLGGSFDASAAVPNPNPDTVDSLPKFARVKFLNDALTELSTIYFKLNKIPGADYSNTAPYYVFSFTIPDSAGSYPGPLALDKQYFVQLETINTVKTRLAGGSSVYEGTDQTELGYLLVDATKPFISAMSYNQTKGATAVFTDIDAEPSSKLIDGAVINQAPFAVKLTVLNGAGAFDINTDLKVNSSPTGSTDPGKAVSIDKSTFATKMNGTTRELWFWINKLPYDGAQTLTINYGIATATVKITFVAGVYVQFDKITDGLVNRYDPTDDQQAKSIVEDVLGNFRGSLMNVPMDEIYYTDDASGNKQNVTLTVNNTKIPLRKQPSGANNKFELDPGSSLTQAQKDVRKLLFDGQNTITLSYVRKDDKGNTIVNYQKSYTFTLFSLNFPEIPKGTSDSIYPYGTDRKTPARDSRFTGSNGSYTTKEVEMNIYGTFDFINLGNKDSTIKAKLNSSDIESGKYVFRVVGPDGKSLEWDLKQNTFTSKNGKKTYSTKDPSGDLDGDLSIVYNDSSDENEQYFEFILKGQKLPSDGTKKVYNFYVYNNGVNGPYASYRLEVGTSGLPYKLLRPVSQRMVPATINQNYLDVILFAEGADSVQVNKKEAIKVDFDGNYDGDVNDSGVDYPGSFKAVVKDLKPNKVNKITFTIKRGSDSITDSFEVYYALANIPGAQFMEAMKANHKIFDGKLNLTFPKNTYLRRVDYNVPENYRTQVFKGHNILFSIANEKDGVVDRYDYIDPKPSGFANLVEELGLTFYSSFDTHFIKASQVYWLDAGLADDPDTSEYDAVDTGLLPHQLPDTKPSLPSFDSVPTNRMLAPTERGSLELSYDSSIVSAASNNITVMRYDPDNRYWENLGGIVNASKKTIKVPFDKFGYYVVAKMNDSFQDVIRHPYARNHIEAMYSKGVIRPKRANEFSPDDDTTRGEFTAMVVRGLQLPLVEKPSTYSFDDVPTIIDRNSLWDYRYIETASRLGLVRGTNPRIFEPTLRITRQEAAVILARALQLKVETNSSKTDKDLQKLFKDYNLIDSYARPYVLAIAKKGFIQGSPIDVNDRKKGYTFDPSANMLRGDAAILMGRVMTDQKKIPAIGEVK